LLEVLANKLQEKETLGTESIFLTILQHLQDEEDIEKVQKKYQRAREMRFEHSREEEEEPEAVEVQAEAPAPPEEANNEE